MAKPSVNSASRDELLEVGVRPDIVDEIMKRRRRKGGITLESLGDIQGVGPATLDRLKETLDFREPPPDAGQDKSRVASDEHAPIEDQSEREQPILKRVQDEVERENKAGEATLRVATEQTADLATAAVKAGVEMADRAAETIRTMAGAGVESAKQGTDAVVRSIGKVAATAKTKQPQLTQPAVPDGTPFGQIMLELLREQGQENVKTMSALTSARRLDQVVEIQREYLRGTMERMADLNRRWLELATKTWPGGATGPDRSD